MRKLPKREKRRRVIAVITLQIVDSVVYVNATPSRERFPVTTCKAE